MWRGWARIRPDSPVPDVGVGEAVIAGLDEQGDLVAAQLGQYVAEQWPELSAGLGPRREGAAADNVASDHAPQPLLGRLQRPGLSVQTPAGHELCCPGQHAQDARNDRTSRTTGGVLVSSSARAIAITATSSRPRHSRRDGRETGASAQSATPARGAPCYRPRGR
jgi:hypothetical protein